MSENKNSRRTREERAKDEATGVLEQYVVADSKVPVPVINIDTFIVEKAMAHPQLDHTDAGDLELVGLSVRDLIKERCVNELTRLDRGRVVLDTEGHHGTLGYKADDVPSIVFCALTSQDSLSEHGRAMAVYFDPSLVGKLVDRSKGGEKPNIYQADGYVTIVRFFPTVADAQSACRDLYNAVQVIARDPNEAVEPDPAGELPRPGATLTAL